MPAQRRSTRDYTHTAQHSAAHYITRLRAPTIFIFSHQGFFVRWGGWRESFPDSSTYNCWPYTYFLFVVVAGYNPAHLN
jgi:hypothetical protein